MSSLWISIVPAILLAGTHILLHAVEVRIENKEGWHWLSIFSGISASYVFLGLIPDIDKYRYALDVTTELEKTIDKRFYALLILAGFTIFYSIESLVKRHRKIKTIAEDVNPLTPSVPTTYGHLPCNVVYIFAIHILAFTVYGFAISFLLPKKLLLYGAKNMWFYYAAMQAHYIIDDMTLHDHFGVNYDKYGRIPLILGTIAGFIVGFAIEFPVGVVAAVASFIAGGTIFNILKTELPTDTKASVPLFLLGLIFYTLLIIFLY